jgi:hypothetical protein
MPDRRETDFLAYILAAFVIAIGGIAVGIASTNAASNGDARTAISAVNPAAAATKTHAQSADGRRRVDSQQHFL